MGPRFKIDVIAPGAASSMWGNGKNHLEAIKAELIRSRDLKKKPFYIRVSDAADNLPSPPISFR